MPSTHNRLRLGADIAVVAAATIVLHVALAEQSGIIASGGLRDTDAYMRLIRVEELWQSGDWYQTITSSLGAPDGLSLHWTRPLDILILAPAMVLNLAGMAIDRAIYWSGVAISPIMQFLACLAAASAARPLWERHGAWRVAALMMLFNGAAVTYSVAGRPDHHSLVLLLTVLAIGQTIAATLDPWNTRRAFRAGAWAAAAIWVSPEAMVGAAPILVTFGLLWLLAKPGPEGRQWLVVGRYFCLGMAAITLLAITIEQPPENWLKAEYDKVSILHLLIALTVCLDFRIAEAIAWTGWRRVIGAGGVAILSGAALALIFPGFYLGPLGGVTDQTVRIFLDDVKEMSPLWPLNREVTDQFFGIIGNSLAALPVIPYCLWQWRGRATYPAAVLLTLTYLTALLGALLHQRLAVPLAASGAVLGCGLFVMLVDLAAHRTLAMKAVARLMAAFIVVFGGQLWLLMNAGEESAKTKAKTTDACEPKPVADWLNDTNPGGGAPRMPGVPRQTPIFITESINYTPDLAYRTGYRFVGGPYHRGIDDIADMYYVATGVDDDAVQAILARRQADYLLICIIEVPKVIGESAPDSLYHRLLRGDAPDWLQPLPMSAEASREFRLFAIKR
ncbi:hypothetical protein [Dongia sp.]|uniref:hypothetical protein n=1 Tax=Dongia sp. TaxID=1977262 RepID=UPI0035B0BAE7